MSLNPSPDLHGRRILIVEDDYFIAEELRRSFQKAGVVVVGPVPRADEALHLLRSAAPIDAAVLDINLEDGGPVFPVVSALEALGVPFVFASGYGCEAIPKRFAAVKCFEKPCNPDQILRYLMEAVV